MGRSVCSRPDHGGCDDALIEGVLVLDGDCLFVGDDAPGARFAVALTAKDLDDLPFVANNADVVDPSFVRRPADIDRLQQELRRLDAADLGIVLKVENLAAFENLPDLLLTAMRSPVIGVMIARGDLAVEVGFEPSPKCKRRSCGPARPHTSR